MCSSLRRVKLYIASLGLNRPDLIYYLKSDNKLYTYQSVVFLVPRITTEDRDLFAYGVCGIRSFVKALLEIPFETLPTQPGYWCEHNLLHHGDDPRFKPCPVCPYCQIAGDPYENSC